MLRLRKLVGLRRVKEFAITGRLCDTSETAEIGLINEAVLAADLDGLTKWAFHGNLGRSYGDALDCKATL